MQHGVLCALNMTVAGFSEQNAWLAFSVILYCILWFVINFLKTNMNFVELCTDIILKTNANPEKLMSNINIRYYWPECNIVPYVKWQILVMKHGKCTEDVTHLFCKGNQDETGLQFILEKTNLILKCHLHISHVPNTVLYS